MPYRFTRAWTWTTGSVRMGPESRETSARPDRGVQISSARGRWISSHRCA
ncbi:DUF995 domain-containing protein [Streptomyces sp. DI166]